MVYTAEPEEGNIVIVRKWVGKWGGGEGRGILEQKRRPPPLLSCVPNKDHLICSCQMRIISKYK